jgi:hypothetical protein
MDDEGLRIIREALDTQLRGEDLDRAVGRTVRRRNQDFKKYVEVIGELREMARADSVSVEEVARRLLSKA